MPYILFEIPSNILLKKFKPHVWLSGCAFLFGFVTICQGLVTNYSGLLATRFFLGVAETGMFPGSFYLIGMWYKRSEAQRRFSFFFSSTSLAGKQFSSSQTAFRSRTLTCYLLPSRGLRGSSGHCYWKARWKTELSGMAVDFYPRGSLYMSMLFRVLLPHSQFSRRCKVAKLRGASLREG